MRVLQIEHRISCLSRPSEAERLGVPDLDAETQRALFPNIPTADANFTRSRWKWSDIGTAPALHHFAQQAQHPDADSAEARSRHEQEAHEQGASMASPSIAPTTAKQQASIKHGTAGYRKALLHEGRSAPTSPRPHMIGIHTRTPACSPDPEHYLVSLRWGAHSTPPLHPQLPTAQLSSAYQSGSSLQSPSPPRFSTLSSCYRASPVVPLKSRTPNRGLPSEPHRSDIPYASPSEELITIADSPSGNEARFQSTSPSVARACVTLPGFFPPAKAQRLGEGMSREEPHKPAATPSVCKHALQSVYEASSNSTVLLSCCSA